MIETPRYGKGNSMKKTNRLIHEKSPYLLQHSCNPVDWYPWGDEAFEAAKLDNRPIFLSIGYSTCHWCHVMEEECFSDPEVARLMNGAFINIKVDREERPDIDGLYMAACQILGDNCGWPLNIVMTPGKKPFFAASYIPKENRFGRTGMAELIPDLMALWASRKGDINKTAEEVTLALRRVSEVRRGGSLGEAELRKTYEQLAADFDPGHGGFGNMPKFPTPHNLLYLLRYWRRTGETEALHMVEKTLEAIRLGGVYDHIGFGVHRYSTDARWLVPHFEKMLYDQAMLSMAYTETWQATGKAFYGRTAREIFDYVLREMMAEEGGFLTAEDADSEGEEGKFYLWREAEVREVLKGHDSELFMKLFNVGEEGNFIDALNGRKTGENILHLSETLEELARKLNVSEASLLKEIDRMRRMLFAAREKKIRPFKDDKILTDWNGLMIASLAKGAQAFGEPQYTDAAEKAARFILDKMIADNGGLLHRYREGEAAIVGHVDDYAFLIYGLIELYGATFDAGYLKRALDLNSRFIKDFWDDSEGGFFSTGDTSELIVRRKEIYDGAVPSGNSIAMLNLLRLGRMTGNTKLEEMAADMGRTFSAHVERAASGFAQLMSAVDFAVGPTCEIVITGHRDREDTNIMIEALRRLYLPGSVVLFKPAGETLPEITKLAGYTKYHSAAGGQATACVCQNFKCNRPTTDPTEMIRNLEGL